MYTPAIVGAMRRVARKPIVTAGFRWPEIRMVAVIMTPRMSPWANAISSRLIGCPVARASSRTPLPTKTRAKVPMNSATA